MSFEHQFIYFHNFEIKYSLVIFYFILITMIVISLFNKKRYKIKNIYSKKNTIKVFLTYTSLIPFFWWNHFLYDKDEFLVNLCKFLLSIEFIFIIVLIVAISYGVIIYSNKDTYFNSLIFPTTIFLYVDIFSVIVVRQVNFLEWYNIRVFIFLGIFIWFINNIRLEKIIVSESNNDSNINSYYSAIDRVEDLFEQRKWDVNYLKKLINNYKGNESLSICVSGEWGKGKTSFTNVLLNELDKDAKKDNKKPHKIIRINAMDMDSVESLFKYLFDRIKNELKKENYYIGISSEYQDYVSSVIEIISKAKIKSNVIKGLFEKEKDYRENKENLQEILNQMLSENKLIIVVDDIERCDADKVSSFIKFIKEIITFKNFIIIFLTDYDQLTEVLKEKPIKYLDKFFDRRINLPEVSYNEVIKHFIEKNSYNLKILPNTPIHVTSEIDNWISKIEKKILALEEEKQKQTGNLNKKEEIEKIISNINELNKKKLFIKDILNNPRNIVKLLSYINEKCTIINSEFSNEFISIEEREKYLNKVEASTNIIILSFVQTVMQEKYEEIQELGFSNYVNFLCDVTSDKDYEDELIECLVLGIWYENYYTIPKIKYKHNEVDKFITSLLKAPYDLNKIVNGFTSYDEKYIEMVKSKNYTEMYIDFIELFSIIVKNFSNENSDEGYEVLEKLFEHLLEQIEQNKIIIDDVFNIFDESRGFIGYYEPKLNVMKLFYKKFCCKNVVFKNASEVKEKLNLLCRNYIPMSSNNLNKILRYNFNMDKGIKVTLDAVEKSRLGDSFDQILNFFCDELEKDFKTTEKNNTEKNNIEKIKNFLNKCKEELSNVGFLEIEYIKDDLKQAFEQVEEYEYLQKIIIFVDKQQLFSEYIDLNNIMYDDIEKGINYFMEEFRNKTFKSFKAQCIPMIDNFFRSIEQLGKDNIFSDELANKLLDLIREYRDYSKREVDFYYRIMFDIKKKIKCGK